MAVSDQIVNLRKLASPPAGHGGAKEDTSVVYIHANRIIESINPQMISVKMPVTKTKQGSGIGGADRDAGTLYYDMKRFMHKYTIVGFLEAQDYNGDGTVETAKQVKDYLYRYIFVTPGDILLQWRSQVDSNYHPTSVIKNYTHDGTYVHCYLESARFEDSGKRGETTVSGDASPRKYGVNMVLVRGITR